MPDGARTQGSPSNTPAVTQRLATLFAFAAAFAISNIYSAQPLLAQIAVDLGVPTASAGMLITATQIGYALGVLLIVPLGDMVSRKMLIPLTSALSVVALLGCAFAPSFGVLASVLVCIGFTSLSGQLLIPFVRENADPAEAGHMVGIVAMGIMFGILLSRTVSGLVAAVLGWRAVYILCALFSLCMTIVMARVIPQLPPRARIAYPTLIASVFRTAVHTRGLIPILLMGGLSFVTFNLFWTSTTFLLSSEPFLFNTFQIGLVSLAGLTGAVASPTLGRIMDRGKTGPGLGVLTVALLVSMVIAFFATSSFVFVVIAAAILSVGSHGINLLCQTMGIGLVPGAASRLNTIVMVNNFVSAAIGSALASVLWTTGGWTAIVVCGMVACALCLVAWRYATTHCPALQ